MKRNLTGARLNTLLSGPVTTAAFSAGTAWAAAFAGFHAFTALDNSVDFPWAGARSALQAAHEVRSLLIRWQRRAEDRTFLTWLPDHP